MEKEDNFTGTKTTYFDKEQTRKDKVIPFVKGQIHGIQIDYWSESKRYCEAKFKYGQKHGEEVNYWIDGTLWHLECFFHNTKTCSIFFDDLLNFKNLPKNKRLFNKNQFKELCKQAERL